MQSLPKRQRNKVVVCSVELQDRAIHFRNMPIRMVSILKHEVHGEPAKLTTGGFNHRRKRCGQNQSGWGLISATLNRGQLYSDSSTLQG